MRFWKIVLIAAIPIGGYWLYKKSGRPSEIDIQPEPAEDDKTTSESPPRGDGEEESGMSSTEQIIERLTEIDGVTSRVAENLIEKGIYTKEELTKLSREELMEIKGIGPKRAEKILKQ